MSINFFKLKGFQEKFKIDEQGIFNILIDIEQERKA